VTPRNQRLDVVTFDYWNTLVYERPGELRTRRLDAWLGLLDEARIPVTRSALDELFEQSWQTFARMWRENRGQLQGPDAARLILTDLGHDLTDELRDQLIDAFVFAGDDADINLAEGIGDVLPQLAEAGLRIGIICDVGMTPSPVLRAHLERLDVLRFFDHWSFSDEVGVYKPDRRIFEHALAGLGNPDQARAAHVGDLRATDVAGSRAMGMVSIRYTGVFDDPMVEGLPEADHVVAAHSELVDLLR
jgi:FMN phosphatase YigB (HAD superfamily)